jgi:hypothetical protein
MSSCRASTRRPPTTRNHIFVLTIADFRNSHVTFRHPRGHEPLRQQSRVPDVGSLTPSVRRTRVEPPRHAFSCSGRPHVTAGTTSTTTRHDPQPACLENGKARRTSRESIALYSCSNSIENNMIREAGLGHRRGRRGASAPAAQLNNATGNVVAGVPRDEGNYARQGDRGIADNAVRTSRSPVGQLRHATRCRSTPSTTASRCTGRRQVQGMMVDDPARPPYAAAGAEPQAGEHDRSNSVFRRRHAARRGGVQRRRCRAARGRTSARAARPSTVAAAAGRRRRPVLGHHDALQGLDEDRLRRVLAGRRGSAPTSAGRRRCSGSMARRTPGAVRRHAGADPDVSGTTPEGR